MSGPLQTPRSGCFPERQAGVLPFEAGVAGGGHARRGAGMAGAPVAVPDLALLLPREAVSCLTPKPARVASAGCLHLPPYSPEAFPLRLRPLLIVNTHTQINEY